MSDPAEAPPSPRHLRTRVTLYFLLVTTPALALTAAFVWGLDARMREDIMARTNETEAEAKRILDDERARVRVAVAEVARSEAVRELAFALEQPNLYTFEDLAARLAPAHGLELLALVPLDGPHAGTLASSAHLPAAVGDPAPPFAKALADADGPAAGVAHVYVEGNPPELVPALIAAALVPDAGGARLLVYGGARLDGFRLSHVARAGQAVFVLRSPGIEPAVFPPDAAPPGRRSARTLRLPALPSGRALTAPGLEADPGEPTRLAIYADTARLRETRALTRTYAGALLLASLFAAVLAGAFLSRRLTRPIVELSDAARRVGAGDLDVAVPPRSNDEVGTLVRVFNDMTRELKDSRDRLARAERVAAWQQIARRVAHEIKNPLFPIQMSMETLKKSYAKRHPKLDEIVDESTRTVLEEVRALNRIVTEFSDFARLPALEPKPEDPVAVLAHVHGLYRAPEGAETASVTLDPEALRTKGLPRIHADRAQLCRALINLVKNAAEALAHTGGTVTLDARAAPHKGRPGVWLEVKDDGPGIPEDVKASLFTPYFTTKPRGTGLGLAIVDRIATEHGGEIEVHSEVGAGATFRIWLPAADA